MQEAIADVMTKVVDTAASIIELRATRRHAPTLALVISDLLGGPPLC